jgi:hypothetical protein
MCEDCDPEALQPLEPRANARTVRNYVKFTSSSYSRWCALHISRYGIKPTAIVILFCYLLTRIHGNGEIRPGPDQNESGPTYPYTYDELDPEFDQHGRGIFFLPASTTGDNIKNAALRQNFDASLPLLIRLAVTALMLSVIEIPLLLYVSMTGCGTSPFNAGEWNRQYHQREQSKSQSLRRNIQVLLAILYCFVPPAAQLGVAATLVAAETVLANRIWADPIIAAYLDQTRREYPNIDPRRIKGSLEFGLHFTWAYLAVSSLHAVVSLAALVCMRLAPAGRPRQDSVGSGRSEGSVLTSAEGKQVLKAEAEWEDTGALARAYNRQLESVGCGVVEK